MALQVADRLWLMMPGSLHIGSPRQLADEGVLSEFVETGDGISLDPHTLAVHIKKSTV